MTIRLMVGDVEFTEYDQVPDDSRTAPTLAMTLATEYGQVLVMEFEQVKEEGKVKTYAMSGAFTLRPQHLNALENLKKDLAANAPSS